MFDHIEILISANPGTLWACGNRNKYGYRNWYIKTTKPEYLVSLRSGEITHASRVTSPIEQGNWSRFLED
jgi:hypothetical protein